MNARRRNLAVPIGVVLLLLGIVISGRLLEATILPAGTIVGTARRAPALALCRVALGILGLYLVVRRPSLTTVRVVGVAIGTFFGAGAGVLLLQVAYVPPHIVAGWKAFAPANERNEFGYRGHSVSYSPDDFVVVLLGDSQVEAMAMPFDGMPERRLEAHLNASGRKARVFSVGAGGYGQDQELLGLQSFLAKYRVDTVYLWQTPGNDIWNNLFKTHMAGNNPKPTFWLDESGRLAGPSEALDQPLANSPIVAMAVWQRIFGLPWRDKSWERQLPKPYTPMDRFDGPVRMDWQTRWDGNIGRMRDENLSTEKSHLAIGLTPRSPRMQYGLDLTRALLSEIRDVVVRHHGKLVMLRVDSPALAPEGEQMYLLNGKYYSVSNKQFYQNMAYIDRGFETEVVPLTIKDWRVSTEDGHLNAQATDQVMSELAIRLRRRQSEAHFSSQDQQ